MQRNMTRQDRRSFAACKNCQKKKKKCWIRPNQHTCDQCLKSRRSCEFNLEGLGHPVNSNSTLAVDSPQKPHAIVESVYPTAVHTISPAPMAGPQATVQSPVTGPSTTYLYQDFHPSKASYPDYSTSTYLQLGEETLKAVQWTRTGHRWESHPDDQRVVERSTMIRRLQSKLLSPNANTHKRRSLYEPQRYARSSSANLLKYSHPSTQDYSTHTLDTRYESTSSCPALFNDSNLLLPSSHPHNPTFGRYHPR
jgi:hypothetical protein